MQNEWLPLGFFAVGIDYGFTLRQSEPHESELVINRTFPFYIREAASHHVWGFKSLDENIQADMESNAALKRLLPILFAAIH